MFVVYAFFAKFNLGKCVKNTAIFFPFNHVHLPFTFQSSDELDSRQHKHHSLDALDGLDLSDDDDDVINPAYLSVNDLRSRHPGGLG